MDGGIVAFPEYRYDCAIVSVAKPLAICNLLAYGATYG
jgi:hypothetical protein